ncbi:MAG: D-alanyl-D-alanine carboxypeptidase/D-alanyl-D-alanine endopeptidase [Planctomycetota bacterium]|jgi:D-alanyl-D-alanine carboxypeptidase/D-alanyl-D-alanine-endopeptidase (penicillin-binding protein 4)
MKRNLKKLLIIALLVCVCNNAVVFGNLARSINSIINKSLQQKVVFSIHVVEAKSSKTIYEYQGHKALIPASNMKIITTAAALEYLGPDYEYITEIFLADDTLVIIGSGDPLLGDSITDTQNGKTSGWIFDEIETALKSSNNENIKNIIVDTSIFDDQLVHSSWPQKDLNHWYACEVSGLNFNSNCIEITATNNSGRINLTMEPNTSFVKIKNQVKPIQDGSGAIGSYRQKQINDIVVFGKCKKKQGPIKVAIERPSAFFGFLLAEKLTNSSVSVEGQFIEKKYDSDTETKRLLTYRTKLPDVLARCNKNSFGLAAESLVKTIAAENNPYNGYGSWAAGTALISQYLLKLGVEKDEFQIDDGSGLSRNNKLSANSITAVLASVYDSYNWNVFMDSLAVGGVDGTIAKYFKEKKYKGRILGKTGYISGVKSFSGVCTTNNGDYIFSILTNNANGNTRPVINNIAKAIIDEYD